MMALGVELHNVEQLVSVPGREGLLLQRIPERVRAALSEEAQAQYRQAAGCELRFVVEGRARLSLRCYGEPSTVVLMYGDCCVRTFRLTDEPITLTVERSNRDMLGRMAAAMSDTRFATAVCRIAFLGGEIHLLDAQGEMMRPPLQHEVPAIRYIAYGTSITQGLFASAPHLTYVHQTAWRLGADAINLGSSGSAFCEPELGRYIGERSDWDIATLCISVNMLNSGVSVSSFRDTARTFIEEIVRRQPGKPVVCIGLLPFYSDLGYAYPGKYPAGTPDEYRAALREAAESVADADVHYIPGPDLLTRWDGMSADLIHPGDLGMTEIAERLAPHLARRLR